MGNSASVAAPPRYKADVGMTYLPRVDSDEVRPLELSRRGGSAGGRAYTDAQIARDH